MRKPGTLQILEFVSITDVRYKRNKRKTLDVQRADHSLKSLLAHAVYLVVR